MPINPTSLNNDDPCATEGASEQGNAAKTRSFNTSHPESNDPQSRNSLDVLVEDHRDSFTTADSNTAANVALPQSITSTSSVHEQSNNSGDPRSVHHQTYSREIRRLSRYMPHLKNVRKASRAHKRAALKCLDFSGGHLVSNEFHRLESNTLKSEEDFVQSLIGNIPSEVDDRLLIVDDLSDTLIYLLGNCLHITPELFEEHLLNSGWYNNAYEDRDTDLWSTRDLAKSYASIRWYRPVEQRVARPYEEKASGGMLDPLTTPDSWEENPSPTRRILHFTKPLVNLLRRPWEADLASMGFSAWEEKATVWETFVGGCHIMRHRVKFRGKPTFVQTRKSTRAHRERDRSISESQGSQEPEDGGTSRGQARLSILSRIKRSYPNVFSLRKYRKALIAVAPETESQVEERSQSSSVQTVPEDDRPKDNYEDICLFMNSVTRLPVFNYEDLLSPEKEHWLSPGMSPEKSTACTLEEVLQSRETQALNPRAQSAPLESLLVIILHDTLTILRSIDLALTDMDGSMLDDELLQSSIDSWRRVLNRFESELRHVETSLPEFARYIVDPEAVDGPRTCGKLLGQCTLQVAKVQERRRITYGSLMTAMSLVESKRGISEAESVTKLTELAFFFIPLTFAASLFSMQVKELDASTTSVGVFFGVALTITVCSYALRLVIRSSAFLRFLGRWKNEIRTSTGSPPGVPIATTMVLRWIWNRLSSYMYPVYVVIPTAAVLAALWTRSLQEGIKVGVTIALAMILFAVVLFLVLQRLDKRAQVAWEHAG
ncbi:MAG: hypothetical protein LQ348_002970 [Seirophora lacunosa]|nr:MAG: hypothetical protein LQ348_002970 [Seirophora lacunosa]